MYTFAAEMIIEKQEPNHLLEKTIALFMRFGVRSVSMDDVAREAGVSKKTIYQHYGDRNGLVLAAIHYHLKLVEVSCSGIFEEHKNPIDQLLGVSLYFHNMVRQINPNLFFELSKYFPQAWKVFSDHRANFVQKQVLGNIERGMELGLYRSDIKPNIIANVYTCLIDVILDEERFPKAVFSFKELQREIVLYHIHGICTPKGIYYLNEKQLSHE